ncbi:unnamed protein product [Linum trigynum]|uniref:Retrotransposon gag domain-containing protein n=1 Tax=Linum trigynum TaxID=586398 RepID=A0AAV2F396_9ROSI
MLHGILPLRPVEAIVGAVAPLEDLIGAEGILPFPQNHQVAEREPFQAAPARGNAHLLPRLEFPSFDGEAPREWISKCDKLFETYAIPNDQKVNLAVIGFERRPDVWFEGWKYGKSELVWEDFVVALCQRFGSRTYGSVVAAFNKLRQQGSLTEYQEKFEELRSLMSQFNPALDEIFFISSFINGLKQELRLVMSMLQPQTLDQAYRQAKLEEDAIEDCKRKKQSQLGDYLEMDVDTSTVTVESFLSPNMVDGNGGDKGLNQPTGAIAQSVRSAICEAEGVPSRAEGKCSNILACCTEPEQGEILENSLNESSVFKAVGMTATQIVCRGVNPCSESGSWVCFIQEKIQQSSCRIEVPYRVYLQDSGDQVTDEVFTDALKKAMDTQVMEVDDTDFIHGAPISTKLSFGFLNNRKQLFLVEWNYTLQKDQGDSWRRVKFKTEFHSHGRGNLPEHKEPYKEGVVQHCDVVTSVLLVCCEMVGMMTDGKTWYNVSKVAAVVLKKVVGVHDYARELNSPVRIMSPEVFICDFVQDCRLVQNVGEFVATGPVVSCSGFNKGFNRGKVSIIVILEGLNSDKATNAASDSFQATFLASLKVYATIITSSAAVPLREDDISKTFSIYGLEKHGIGRGIGLLMAQGKVQQAVFMIRLEDAVDWQQVDGDRMIGRLMHFSSQTAGAGWLFYSVLKTVQYGHSDLGDYLYDDGRFDGFFVLVESKGRGTDFDFKEPYKEACWMVVLSQGRGNCPAFKEPYKDGAEDINDEEILDQESVRSWGLYGSSSSKPLKEDCGTVMMLFATGNGGLSGQECYVIFSHGRGIDPDFREPYKELITTGEGIMDWW